MTYKVYEKYKDSNIDWINLIPNYWHTYKLKHVINEFVAGGTPKSSNDSFWDENNKGIPWIAIGDMTDNEYINTTSKSITREGLADKNLRILKKGTLIYSIFASLGKTAILNIDATTNQAILGLIISNKIDNIYLKYYLEALQSTISSYSNENTQENLNSNIVKNMEIGMPQSLDEQKQIANYLDKKTSKIDTTISKNKELINLLEEKRTALINQVVTKGLNPEVPMKDTGIEWIEKIPESWEIRKFGHVIELITKGATPTSYGFDFQDAGINFIKVESISKNGEFIASKFNYISPDCNNFLSRSKIKEGDLLFSIAGALGRVAIVNSEILPANTNQALSIIRINNSKLLTEYAFYTLKADYTAFQIDESTVQSAQANLSMESIREFKLIIPPIFEQKEIIDFLNDETTKIDEIINKIQKNINLLEEYKTSLIHYVVTGKIDVRGEEL